MEKNYWFTTHWPPHEKEKIAERVWLKKGKESAGKDLKEGDMVLVYQTKGPNIQEVIRHDDGTEEHLKRIKGRIGIIAVCETTHKFDDKYSVHKEYSNGSKIWWRLSAPLKIVSQSGFVPNEKIKEILKYDIVNKILCSKTGLRKITATEFDSLLKAFVQGTNNTQFQKHQLRPHIAPRGEESEEHKRLKLYVAANTEDVFQEEDITHIKTEYIFQTNDKADVLLEDKYGRIMGVEVEISVDKDNISGILQAIKYRYMAEVVRDKSPGDSRAILVAFDISNEAQNLCKKYNVECFIIAEDKVKQWASKT